MSMQERKGRDAVETSCVGISLQSFSCKKRRKMGKCGEEAGWCQERGIF